MSPMNPPTKKLRNQFLYTMTKSKKKILKGGVRTPKNVNPPQNRRRTDIYVFQVKIKK